MQIRVAMMIIVNYLESLHAACPIKSFLVPVILPCVELFLSLWQLIIKSYQLGATETLTYSHHKNILLRASLSHVVFPVDRSPYSGVLYTDNFGLQYGFYTKLSQCYGYEKYLRGNQFINFIFKSLYLAWSDYISVIR